MVHNKKLFRKSSVKYRTFSEGPTWSDSFSLCNYKMKRCRKLSENCSIHDKNCEIFDPYNSWTPVKINILDVWNWNFGPCFFRKLKWGEGGTAPLPPGSPNGYASASRCWYNSFQLCFNTCALTIIINKQNVNCHCKLHSINLKCNFYQDMGYAIYLSDSFTYMFLFLILNN